MRLRTSPFIVLFACAFINKLARVHSGWKMTYDILAILKCVAGGFHSEIWRLMEDRGHSCLLYRDWMQHLQQIFALKKWIRCCQGMGGAAGGHVGKLNRWGDVIALCTSSTVSDPLISTQDMIRAGRWPSLASSTCPTEQNALHIKVEALIRWRPLCLLQSVVASKVIASPGYMRKCPFLLQTS